MTSRIRVIMRRARQGLAAALVLAGLLSVAIAGTAAVAPAASASAGYAGNRILNAAESRVNDLYSYGAAGPSAFDCSGLVYWAATAAGERDWPRDTNDIARLIGTRFSITYRPQRGDLAMWGSVRYPFHVELVTRYSWLTFGAETYGWRGRVFWHSVTWFRPSFYLHVNW